MLSVPMNHTHYQHRVSNQHPQSQHLQQSFRHTSAGAPGHSPVQLASISAASTGSPSSSTSSETADCRCQQLSSSTVSLSGIGVPPLPLSAAVSASQSSLPPILEEQTESTVATTATMMNALSLSNESAATDDCCGVAGDNKFEMKKESCSGRGFCFCLYCERRDSDCPELASSHASSPPSKPRWRDLDLHGVRGMMSTYDHSVSTSKDSEIAGTRKCAVSIFRR